MTHFVLVDMGRKRGMKNNFVLTKRELQWSLDLENVDHRLKSKPYSFTKDSSDAEERERGFLNSGLERSLRTFSERG